MTSFGFAHVHVDFVAYAEIRQVDAGFDGEAGEGADAPHVVVLEIVHVGAVAVHFHADGMAGAMGEILAEPGLLDDAASGIVHLVPAQRLAGRDGLLHERDAGVARVADRLEDGAMAVGGIVAAESAVQVTS